MTTPHDEKHEHESPDATSASKGFRRREPADVMLMRAMIRKLENDVDRIEQVRRGDFSGLSPFTIGTAAAAALAVIFSVMTWVASNTQDKIDKGTAPLNVQISEMDKRLSGKLDSIDKTLERVNARLDSMEGRMSTIELRLERLDTKLTK